RGARRISASLKSRDDQHSGVSCRTLVWANQRSWLQENSLRMHGASSICTEISTNTLLIASIETMLAHLLMALPGLSYAMHRIRSCVADLSSTVPEAFVRMHAISPSKSTGHFQMSGFR